MLAFPGVALERYFDFFAHHDLTHFCQIGIVRSFTGCPYQFQLGAEMESHYHMGNLNGSLFATEGIASVGPILAPLSALVCGLILSIGNSVSAHLPKRLVATSAGRGDAGAGQRAAVGEPVVERPACCCSCCGT